MSTYGNKLYCVPFQLVHGGIEGVKKEFKEFYLSEVYQLYQILIILQLIGLF